MQTSPSASETVCVMLNQLTIRNLFVDKQNLAQPVKLLNVSPSKDVTCFNTNFIWYLVSVILCLFKGQLRSKKFISFFSKN